MIGRVSNWALIDRAEAAESWEELEQGEGGAPAIATETPAPADEEQINWSNVASEVNIMLELNGSSAAAEKPAEEQEP